MAFRCTATCLSLAAQTDKSCGRHTAPVAPDRRYPELANLCQAQARGSSAEGRPRP